jgi:hypothetical protein
MRRKEMRKKSREVELLKQLHEVIDKAEMYRNECVKLKNELDNVNYKPLKYTPPFTKQQLETQLADINYKEKWPLCHAIKNNDCIFVEFYVHGKSIGKYTNKGAVEFSKKYIKQTDWVEIGKWGIRDSAYEVKKIRKERD